MATRKPRGKEEPQGAAVTPRVSRPELPPDYGISRDTKGLLPWSHVTDRMARAQHYWISTVRPDGRPHATPVDGLWLDERLYFGGSPQTRWRRNLAINAAMSVHLESALDVVILQGDVKAERPDRALAERLSEASKRKYGYAPKPADYEKMGVQVFRPRVAFAWTNLPKDATRWHIE